MPRIDCLKYPSVTLILLAMLAGCGFKLRGTVEIPPELSPIYLEAAGGPLRDAIIQRLDLSEARLAQRRQDARIVIRIRGESRGSRVAAVDRAGKAVARELHYQVTFDALGQDGTERVPSQSLDLVRTYENPDLDVLGKQLEEDLIYEDLVQDAADRILGRLRAALL